MAVAFAREGVYRAPASVVGVDSAHPDHPIIVPDAQLLFTAQFHRAGPDLVLIGQDGGRHIVPGYFASEHRPGLVAPNGASISSYLIDLLAGSPTPGEYAQAQPTAAPANPIGKVEKVVGDVTVIRNGVSVALNVGDVVHKSDVVQTGDHSSLGIGFPDGSALNLVANTRMALSDYSYDPASTSNVALFNLIEGGLSFVAGKVAHTGDMHIGTPIATMGIRGTAGWLYEDPVPVGVTATAGNVTMHFAAVFDQVTSTESTYVLYAVDANGQIQLGPNGQPEELASVSSTQNGLVTTLSGNGIGVLPMITTGPPDFTQQQFQQNVMPAVVNMAIQAIQQFQQQNNPTPHSNPNGGTGSGGLPNNNDNGTNPNDNTLPPLTENENLNGATNATTSTVTLTVAPLVITPPPQPTKLSTAIDIWSSSSGANWNTGQNWSGAAPPGPQDTAVIEPSGQSTINGPIFVDNLNVIAGASLAVISNTDPTVVSSLTVSGSAEVAGTVTADSTVTDPVVTFNNGLTVDAGQDGQPPGEVEAHGSAAEVFITGGSGVDNSGSIVADDGGTVVFFNVGVTNLTGTIEANGDQADVISTVAFENSTVDNAGATISANVSAEGAQALVQLADSIIQGGTLTTGDLASNAGGEFEIVAAPGTNFSELDGSSNGPLTLNAYVQVDDGANLELLGTIVNAGTVMVGAGSGASLMVSGPVTLQGTGAIVLDGDPSIITGAGDPSDALINAGNTISGSGTIEDLTLTNQSGGVIDASADGILTVNTASNTITNSATLEATKHGELAVQSPVDNSGGTVTASNGFIDFNLGISGGNATVTDGGKLEYGWSSDVATAIIGSGTLVLDHQNQSDPSFETAAYTGTVTSFGPGAVIDLTDLIYSPLAIDVWNSAANTLTISSPTGVASISLAGAYTQNSFALTSDGGAGPGTEVMSSPIQVTLGGLDKVGDAVDGTPVTVTLGDTGVQDITYEWFANGALVGTASSFAPTASLQGQTLDLLVGFTDPNNSSATDTVTALAGIVTAPPTITAPTPQAVGVNQADPITGVSVSESGNTTLGEIFTAVLIDSSGGALSVTPGAGVAGDGSDDVVITGTLSQVNAELATLTDKESATGTDTITVAASDSLGNSAAPQTITVMGAPVATFGGIVGIINYSNNDNVAYSGPQISNDGNTLTLTNDNVGEYGSWFTNNTYSIDSFTASFDYQATGAGDGMAFILQDDPRGILALGTNFDANGGSGLGYEGISPSAAIEFNIFAGHVQGTNFATDGSVGNYNSTGQVAFWNGDEIHVALSYNGSVLSETLTDLVNGATYSASYAVNLAQVLGSNVAYLGFSAATGALASTETVSNFTFQEGTVISPAGLAGSPVNLALANPAAANGSSVRVTVTGVPADWSLNQGTNLGNGTWMVETDDLSALTVITSAAYAAATILNVTESWTNADGSTATAYVADNVEAYAPGSPIFALTGDDTLSGGGGNDTYVFAQPIGNDTIYNFNVASDKIDLIGFTGIGSFADLQIADGANGNAVITLGNGETITLHGVDAGSLTANDFVFDQTPVTDNAGTLAVSDGAVLPLSGIVDNTGTIALNSIGDQTELQLIGDGVTLEGGGQLTLSNNSVIVGTNPAATLTNVDNIISGAGQIGAGDGNLTLINDAHGTIIANVSGGTLVLDTGNTIINQGVLEAANGGILQIDDPVSGGSAIIAGGTLDLAAPASVSVAFNNGIGTPEYGDLVLGNAADFSGNISGFAGTAPDLAHSDVVDLVGFDFAATTFAEADSNGNAVVTATDGNNVASLTFDNFDGTLVFASDTNGGTLITDPPLGSANEPSVPTTATSSTAPAVSVTIGGPGNDNFIFGPGIGADTVSNFNSQQDTIELDHFANAQTVQELQALISADVHGDAVINLGHNDSITLAGVTETQLQHVIQAGHVLLH